MNVLHAYSGNLFGGIETLLLALARHRAFCPEMRPSFALCFEGELGKRLTEAGTPALFLGEARARNPWSVRRVRRAFEDELHRITYDAVICHAPWTLAMLGPAVERAGVPLVFWQHDAATGRHWVERWARRTRPRLVVCNSHFTAATLPTLFRDVPAEVVYCPVAPPSPRSWQDDRTQVRARLKIPETATVVVQACRMESWKGHRQHLEALARLRDLPGWVCLMVGGPQRPREEKYFAGLQRLASSLGIADRVRWVGQRSDVSALLAASDIHCQPNTSPEPFGIAFVEALLAGLPAVTSGIGGAVEILDRDTGILVGPGNSAALAEALRPLITDPALRAPYRLAGPRRARELCDPATRILQLRQALDRGLK